MKKMVPMLFALTIIGWHLWSLPYSPLPWFDETFFASITHSFMQGKGFMLEVCPMQTGKEEVLTYGPVYFMANSLCCHIFGFGIVGMRLVNLLSAIAVVWLTYRIMCQLAIAKRLSVGFSGLLAFDVIFLQNAHSGRMDLLALSLLLGAIYFALMPSKPICTAVIGLLGTLAALTTLRIGVMVVPVFAFLFFRNIRYRQWLPAVLLPLTSISIYALWIIRGFGSFGNFIVYFTGGGVGGTTGTSQSLVESFLGGNLHIPWFQLPLVTMGVASAFYLLIIKKARWPLVLLILPIAMFYIFVKDTGLYSAMVVTFWYILGACAFDDIKKRSNNISISQWATLIMIGALATVNIGIFSIKSLAILGGLNERDAKHMEKWMSRHLPPGSRLVGDDRYFYEAIALDCDFQYIDRIGTPEERALYHQMNFDPQYLLVSSQTPETTLKAYEEMFIFKDIVMYTPPQSRGLLKRFTQLVPANVSSSYAGMLIRLESKNASQNP